MAYTTIDDPSVYFQTALYTGNETNRTITNDGNSDLQPDFLWVKNRTHAEDHNLVNTLIGVNKYQVSNTNAGEASDTDRCTGVTSDGFTIGTDHRWNRGSGNYAVWQWLCTGGTRTATAGEADNANNEYDLHANQDAGFSINAYVGTGANSTVPHGLGAVPDMVIVKKRSSTDDWGVQLANVLGNTNALRLNNTDAYGGSNGAGWWNDTSPTSTTVSLGTRSEVNQDTKNYIMYCFKNIQGYSKIGKYTGNGSTDGPFIYTGFKPAWVIVKGTSSGREWFIFDGTRNPTNPFNKYVKAESTDAEASSTFGDFCSNGFKVRSDGASYNTNGQTFIYMAFAESPFVSSKGVPTTAR